MRELIDGDALLSDGTVVRVRPIEPADGEGLVAFHEALSPEAKRRRFFSAHTHLTPAEVTRFTTVDHDAREALVAVEPSGSLIGVGRWDRTPTADTAEVAFVVAEGWRGRGVASLLLDLLAERARRLGITRFVAETLWENEPMRAVFRHSGLLESSRFSDGTVHVEMPLGDEPAPQARRRTADAGASSISRILHPHAVAVVAEGEQTALAEAALRNIVDGGYHGDVHVVCADQRSIAGFVARSSLADIGALVDLVMICAPGERHAALIDECAAVAPHGIVLLSLGHDGPPRSPSVVVRARRIGSRLVGPDSFGVVSAEPPGPFHGAVGPMRIVPGTVSVAAQSAALGLGVVNGLAAAGMGVSSYLSLGDALDLGADDILEFWADEPSARSAVLQVDAVPEPRRFAERTAAVTRRRPLLLLKSGRDREDDHFDALLAASGAIRVDTVEQLLDQLCVIDGLALPRGPRLAIVGNSSGVAALAADAADREGLVVVRPNGISELPADASLGDYERDIEVASASGAVDTIVVVHAPGIGPSRLDVAKVASAAVRSGVRIVLVAPGHPRSRSLAPDVACIEHPEGAVAAIARAWRYAAWRYGHHAPRRPVGADRTAAAARVRQVADAPGSSPWLAWPDTSRLLADYGISTAPTACVADLAHARRAAHTLGYPVALKAVGPQLVHKTGAHAVELAVHSQEDLDESWSDLERRLGPRMTGALVQPMAEPRAEIGVAVYRLPHFGAFVSLTAAQPAAGPWTDRITAVAPLAHGEAVDLVRRLRSAPALDDDPAQHSDGLDALATVVADASWLVADHPDIAALELDPVAIVDGSAFVLDARLRIGAPADLPDRLLDPAR